MGQDKVRDVVPPVALYFGDRLGLAGFGRAFVYNINGIGDAEPVDLSGIPFLNWDLPTTMAIGYRFGK